MYIKKILENKISLNEMATVCGKMDQLGILIVIYSYDHNPPHMHIQDYDKNEICQILITDKIPSTINDIQLYKGSLPNKLKEKIIEWANKNNKFGVNNWIYTLSQWDIFQNDK